MEIARLSVGLSHHLLQHHLQPTNNRLRALPSCSLLFRLLLRVVWRLSCVVQLGASQFNLNFRLAVNYILVAAYRL